MNRIVASVPRNRGVRIFKRIEIDCAAIRMAGQSCSVCDDPIAEGRRVVRVDRGRVRIIGISARLPVIVDQIHGFYLISDLEELLEYLNELLSQPGIDDDLPDLYPPFKIIMRDSQIAQIRKRNIVILILRLSIDPLEDPVSRDDFPAHKVAVDRFEIKLTVLKNISGRQSRDVFQR